MSRDLSNGSESRLSYAEEASSTTIDVDRTVDGVAFIRLNRPERRNAIYVQMVLDLERAFDECGRDNSVRVVILGAIGPAFSAGHELKRDEGLDLEWERRRQTPEGRYVVEDELYRRKNLLIRDFPKPTIACVQGPAVAAGWMLVSMCDLVIASHSARFQNPVVRMATAGPQVLFEPWDVGIRKAKELLFTGGWLSAEEAYRLGYINQLTEDAELDDACLAMARTIAEMPPWALRLVKQSLNHAADVMGQRESWDYQFLIRNIGHASRERELFMEERRKGKSVREFLESRDASFDDEI